jgi:hypothetical protein
MSTTSSKRKSSKRSSDKKKGGKKQHPRSVSLSSLISTRALKRQAFESQLETFVEVKRPIAGRIQNDSYTAGLDSTAALLSGNKVYTFTLKGFSSLTSNGAGVLNSFLPFDPSPSGYNFSEWASLATLFS